MEISEIEKLERYPRGIKPTRGVYLLRNKKDKVIYIGQSTQIEIRLGQQEHALKPWATVQIIPIFSLKKRIAIEAELIQKYQPKFNHAHTENYSIPRVKKEKKKKVYDIKLPSSQNFNVRGPKSKLEKRVSIYKLLSEKYGEKFSDFSSRQIAYLSLVEHKYYVSHATVVTDLRQFLVNLPS